MNNRIRMMIKALKVACHWQIGPKVKVVVYYKGKKWGEVGGE